MATTSSSSTAAPVKSASVASISSNNNSNNPGQILASTVDAEIGKYRTIQSEIGELRADLQTVLGQRTENELVLRELDLSSSSSSTTPVVIYKKIGPVLIKQDLDESQQTVRKRLEYINNERMRLEAQIESKEREAGQVAARVQQMQSQLQQTTVEAVRAIRQNA